MENGKLVTVEHLTKRYPMGEGEGYAAIRETYIEPIEQAYELCLRITTAIANEFGAHG